MSDGILNLQLHCTACNHRFERAWESKHGQIQCPSCGASVCPCGCGGDLSRNRAKALYCTQACRKRVERSYNADTSRTGLRSGNVRSVEEAGVLHDTYKREWEQRILRRIKSALDTKGEYHADDCADLPVPAAHVNLIGVQVMRLKNRGIVVKVEDRRNSSKASNSRPSGVYRYAKGGPQKLADLITGPDSGGPSGGSASSTVRPGEGHGVGSLPADKSDHRVPPALVAAGAASPDHLHHGHLPSSSPYSGENPFA